MPDPIEQALVEAAYRPSAVLDALGALQGVRSYLHRARDERRALLAHLEAARDALETYGQHTERCSWDSRGAAESVCDCGLDEAVAALRAVVRGEQP